VPKKQHPLSGHFCGSAALLSQHDDGTTASREDAPVTEHEAFEQIVEELELAGFGAPVLDRELEAAAHELARRH